MPTKKGAGGRQQNYDSHTGRFTKTDYSKLYPPREPSRKEKAQKRELARREELRNRASNSKDPLLFDVFLAIENELPGSVQAVNDFRPDPNLNKPREFDIITKKWIIEIKGGKKPKQALKQFSAQKKYAEGNNKHYVIYAPNMPTMAKVQHTKNGFNITGDLQTLINIIKDHEK